MMAVMSPAAPATQNTEAPAAPVAEKKKQKVKPPYPMLTEKEENGRLKKFVDVPDDYDARIHASLKVQDFKDEFNFWDYQSKRYAKKSEDCKAKAIQCRKLGSKAARRALSLAEKLKELQKELSADANVDQDLLKEALAAAGVTVQ